MFGSGSGGGFGGFGQNKPASGFGAFGQTSSTGTGAGTFGSSSNTNATTGSFGSGFGRSTTSGFGSTGGTFGSSGSNTATSGFGGGTSAFGGASQAPGSSLFGGTGAASTGGFGASTGGFGATSAATGTARAKFEPPPENMESGNANYLNNICAMAVYKNFSPEELRLEDYTAGRKKAEGAAGAGGFGSTSNAATGGFGSTGGFGQTANTAGGFGQPAGGFGQTASTFGQTPAAGTGFGQTAGGFGSSAGSTGTGAFGSSTANRPAFGQPAASGFGSSAGGFGSTPATSTAGGFGSTGGGFGSTTGGFGSTTGGFGSTGGGFGQTPASTAGGFGSSTGFGAKPAFGSTGGFGATATSQPAAATGGFGQPATSGGFGQAAGTGFGANTGSSLFGSSNTGAAAGSAFGQQAATGNTGLFGSAGTAAAGGGLFGAKPATAGSSLFGASANTGAAGGGAFGQQPATGSTGTGLFGSTGAAATGGGAFGSTNVAGSSGGGLFGAKPATDTTAATGGGLFGNTSGTSGGLGFGASSGTTGGGLFGAQQPTGATGGGLFGASGNAAGAPGTTGGGLFGNTGAGTTGGLFGAKPATGTTGGGLFGAQPGTGTAFGGGLFGSGQTVGAQLAGQQQAQQPLLFGQPAAQQPALQPAQLQAQIDKQPYGFSALFDTSKLASKATAARLGSSHLTATPLRASALSQAAGEKEQERRKRGLSLQLLSSPHVASAASSRLRSRGFAAPSAAAVARKAATVGSVAATPRTQRTPAATKGKELAGMFGRDGFLSPEGQLPHSNVKRLVITRKPSFGSASSVVSDRRDLAAADESSPLRDRTTTIGGLVAAMSPPRMDNPWADTPRAARAHAELKRGKPRGAMVVAAEDELDADDEFGAPSIAEQDYLAAADRVGVDDEAAESDDEADASGEYWMRPPLEDLRVMSTQQLRAVRNFTVGRVGVGQVSFNKPVDLTSVGSLSAIAGSVVLFDDRVCTVYPDESNKPPRGQGLNVPATISLHDCWPVDRTTGEHIVRMDDPRVRKHIRRLRKIEETDFVDFVGGTWIFRVEHFSRYGLDDNEEDGYDDEDLVENYPNQPRQQQQQQQQQGFGKATAASTQQKQSHLGGSRAVATQQQQPNPVAPPVASALRNASFSRDLQCLSAADGGSGSETDILATSSQSGEDDEPEVAGPTLPFSQRPPRQLLLGTRHAESLRRAPVMRASLFSTSSEPGPSTSSIGSKRASDATGASTAQAQVQARAGHFGRVQVRSPAVPQTLPARSVGANSMPKQVASSGCKRKGSLLRPAAPNREKSAAAALDLPHPRKYLRTSESRVARELFAAPQPYEMSLTHGRSGMSADAGLMMARSFRVAFGPQGQLVYLHSGHRGSRSGVSSVVVVDNISRHLHAAPGSARLLAHSPDVDATEALDYVRRQHLGMVRAQWEHALIRAENSGPVPCPRVTFRENTTIASVLDAVTRISPSESSSERRVLELASVLFDSDGDNADDGDGELAAEQLARVRTVRQRQALTQWLMSAVYESVQDDLLRASQSKSPAAASMLALLTGHRIEAACLAATSHRDYRLATLIAQCGAGAICGGGNDQQVQALVRAQLDRIAATAVGKAQDMTPEYWRVYEVLAGNAMGAVAAGVDWKRAFGLGLWYTQSPADPIAGAVVAYERAVERTAPVAPAPPPLPGWLFSGTDGAGLATASLARLQTVADAEERVTGAAMARRGVELHGRGVWDPVFQLLKLHSQASYPLENALPSESFSAARGDVRQPAILAWLLAVVRGCRGFDDGQRGKGAETTASVVYDRLLTGWSLQLESLGLWHWACFVLLQLSSDTHKTHAIRALVERSLPSSQPTSTLPPAAGGDLLLAGTVAGDEDFDAVEEQVRFVLYELQLPREWLYDAYVTRSRYDRDWAEARVGAAKQQQQQQPRSVRAVGYSVQQAAAQRTTASGRPIVPSFFNFAQRQQQQQQPGGQRAAASASESAAFGRGALCRAPLDTCAEAVLRQVVWQLSAGQLAAAHALVLQRIAPDAILRGDHRLLRRILERLDPHEYEGVAAEAWAVGGQVFQRFIGAVDGLPAVLQRIAEADEGADMEAPTQQVHAIYRQLCALLTALPGLLAQFDGARSVHGAVGFYDGSEVNWYAGEEAGELRVKYSVAVSDMAAVATGLAQELRGVVPSLEPPAAASDAQADSSTELPLAHDMRIRRTYELARSCFGSLVSSGLEA